MGSGTEAKLRGGASQGLSVRPEKDDVIGKAMRADVVGDFA